MKVMHALASNCAIDLLLLLLKLLQYLFGLYVLKINPLVLGVH